MDEFRFIGAGPWINLCHTICFLELLAASTLLEIWSGQNKDIIWVKKNYIQHWIFRFVLQVKITPD